MELNEAGHSVMFEGAQGTLLDLIFGTYPYVTGAHTIASYVPAGLGIPNSSLGDVMGVAKAYTTRVGGGPFPTEMPDETGEKIRKEGKEYGATTGRPRRVGWLDLVGLKYAVRLNGVSELALTKLDILTKVKEMKVCVGLLHRRRGDFGLLQGAPEARRGEAGLPGHAVASSASSSGRTTSRRPREQLVEFLEDELKVKVTLVSTGEERSATMQRHALDKSFIT